jgi:hypothetical protein
VNYSFPENQKSMTKWGDSQDSGKPQLWLEKSWPIQTAVTKRLSCAAESLRDMDFAGCVECRTVLHGGRDSLKTTLRWKSSRSKVNPISARISLEIANVAA